MHQTYEHKNWNPKNKSVEDTVVNKADKVSDLWSLSLYS